MDRPSPIARGDKDERLQTIGIPMVAIGRMPRTSSPRGRQAPGRRRRGFIGSHGPAGTMAYCGEDSMNARLKAGLFAARSLPPRELIGACEGSRGCSEQPSDFGARAGGGSQALGTKWNIFPYDAMLLRAGARGAKGRSWTRTPITKQTQRPQECWRFGVPVLNRTRATSPVPRPGAWVAWRRGAASDPGSRRARPWACR